MYWTTVSLFFAGESLFQPILSWVPLYSWMRLGLHLYLVLPGSQQGSAYIYRNHLHPFLDRHERQVDQFITNAHDGAKQAGLGYVKQAVEYVKVNVLNMAPKRTPPPPPAAAAASYTQNLFSRFAMPSARFGAVAASTGSGDLLSLLGNTVHQAITTSTKSRDAQVEELTSSGALVPSHISSLDERSTFIATQQDRLRTLLQAYEKEASLASSPPVSPTGTSKDQLKKSKSEAEFVDLAGVSVPTGGEKRPAAVTRQSSGWGAWMFGAKAATPTGAEKKSD